MRYFRPCCFTHADTEMQPYSCTGHFQTDFVELCRRVQPPFVYTPAVVTRPRRPLSPVTTHVVEEKTTKAAKSLKKEEAEKSETPGAMESGGYLQHNVNCSELSSCRALTVLL